MSTTQTPDEVSADEVGATAGTKNENPLMSGRPTTAFPAPIAAKIEEQRMLGQIVSALASQTWGQRMTPTLRRATAQYCLAYGIDPLTELDMLGGNPYPNAEFYLRKLGELRIAGIVADYWLDNLTNDPELLLKAGSDKVPETVREWSRGEHWRRWQRRRELGAKEEAEAVCACHIVLATPPGVPYGHPIVGWKQGGGGTSIKQPRGRDKGGGSDPNPIVEDENNTALAVESQSARRAVRQLKSHVSTPGMLEVARYFTAVDDGAKDLRQQIEAARPPRPDVPEFSGMQVAMSDDPYTPKSLPLPTYEQVLGGAGDRGPAGQAEAIARKVEARTEPAPIVRGPIGSDPYAEESPKPGTPVRESRRWAPINVDVFPGSTKRRAPVRGEPTPGVEIRVCDQCGREVNDPSDHDPECAQYADPD
jgi:hypothetical protein